MHAREVYVRQDIEHGADSPRYLARSRSETLDVTLSELADGQTLCQEQRGQHTEHDTSMSRGAWQAKPCRDPLSKQRSNSF